ncbi:Gfo/Idh/MocA family protein [Marinibacterium sp. SX1]|uniref:Gfo/Idh/MocA family protein n=1 Tax=Marinibacterium sp. SX1 TaxID=3388424 RepID=UPI003D176623
MPATTPAPTPGATITPDQDHARAPTHGAGTGTGPNTGLDAGTTAGATTGPNTRQGIGTATGTVAGADTEPGAGTTAATTTGLNTQPGAGTSARTTTGPGSELGIGATTGAAIGTNTASNTPTTTGATTGPDNGPRTGRDTGTGTTTGQGTETDQAPIGVAIIGAGERGVYYVGSRMAELAAETGFRIVSVHDRLPERARLAAAHLDALYAGAGVGHTVGVAPDLTAAVTDPAVQMVLVTTHTNAHLEPVRAAVRAGKRVYLDKPISVSLADARAIVAAEAEGGAPIMMGFTRRYERPWIDAIALSRTGATGTPRMVLLRSVIPYTRYLQLWHRTNAASGGAINDKGSHHFDVLNWVAGPGARAVSVTAMGGRSSIFAPDPDAPARCSECDRACPYRRHETLIDVAEGVGRVPNDSWLDATDPADRNDNCVYLPGSDIDDHAVVTVQYDSGLVACLFFTIFGPYAEDQETLEIIGESGRLRMERHSGEIDLVSGHGAERRVIPAGADNRDSSHFGADLELVRTMRRFIAGEAPPAGVRDGLASLELVEAARRSMAANGRAVDPRNQEFL